MALLYRVVEQRRTVYSKCYEINILLNLRGGGPCLEALRQILHVGLQLLGGVWKALCSCSEVMQILSLQLYKKG